MSKSTISTLIANNEWQKAFSCARKFFFNLTKPEKRSIEIAADCSNESRQSFYTSIGIDWVSEVANAKQILSAKFL